jgi:hypothetical protein
VRNCRKELRFLTMLKTLENSGEICLFGLVEKPKFLSAVARQKLYTDAISK